MHHLQHGGHGGVGHGFGGLERGPDNPQFGRPSSPEYVQDLKFSLRGLRTGRSGHEEVSLIESMIFDTERTNSIKLEWWPVKMGCVIF